MIFHTAFININILINHYYTQACQEAIKKVILIINLIDYKPEVLTGYIYKITDSKGKKHIGC
jgi:hypothetical protein